MESQFIKERPVIRKQIIKKNLESTKKDDKSSTNLSSLSSCDLLARPSDRIVAIEEFVNENLKQKLVETYKQLNRIYEIIAEYIKIRTALKLMKRNPRDVRVLTNIGCNFYSQCNIEDATKVYLCVGQDYYIPMEIDEAIKMTVFKERQWTERLERLKLERAKIDVEIDILLDLLDNLYKMDISKDNPS